MSDILGLISAGSGWLSNIIGNLGYRDQLAELSNNQMRVNNHAAYDSFKYGEEAANNADARTRQLYNDLESPAAIRQQLLDAGLSVGMMYGSGGAGGSLSSGAQGTGATVEPAQIQTAQILDAQVAQMMAQTAKLAADTQNVKADTAKKESEVPVNEQLKLKLEEERQNLVTERGKIEAEIQNKIANTANVNADTKLKEASERYTNAQKALTELTTQNKEILDQWTIYKFEKEIDILDSQGRKLGIENEILRQEKEYLIKEVMYNALQAEWEYDNLNDEKLKLLQEQIKQLSLENAAEEQYQMQWDKLIEDLGKDGNGKGVAKWFAAILRFVKQMAEGK